MIGADLSRLSVAIVDAASSRPGDDAAGAIAFVVVSALVVASFFLYKSLRRHLGKIDFDEDQPADRPTNGSAGSEPS